MKRLAALLGVLSAILSALVVRPVNSYQGFIAKSTATAQTPALTVLGALDSRPRCNAQLTIRHDHRRTRRKCRDVLDHPGDRLPRWSRASVRAGLEAADPSDAERRMLQHRRSMACPGCRRHAGRATCPSGRFPAPIASSSRTSGSPRRASSAPARPSSTCTAARGTSSTRTSSRAHSSASSPRRATSSWMPRPELPRDGCDRHGGRRASRGCLDQGDAERYGIDPERVVVMGGSSGAHIALLAAYAPHEPKLVPEELHGADTSVMAGSPGTASRRWHPRSSGGLDKRLQPHRPKCGIGRSPARSPTSSTS